MTSINIIVCLITLCVINTDHLLLQWIVSGNMKNLDSAVQHVGEGLSQGSP